MVKNNTQSGFILPVLFIILTVIVVGGGYYLYTQQNFTQNLINNSTPPPIHKRVISPSVSATTTTTLSTTCGDSTRAQLSDITNMATSAALHWVALSPSDISSFLPDRIFFVHPPNNYIPSSDISATGTAWEVVTASSSEGVQIPFDLSSAGWNYSVITNGIEIQTLDLETGDGPGVSGSIRRRGDCVQAEVSTYKYIDFRTENTDDGPYQLEAPPYRRLYKIFVTNWVPISKILEDYKETAH